MSKPLVWESVCWRNGEDHYRFAIERGGLFATLSAPGGRSLTLPMVVWDGLLDALRANRATRQREEQQQFPSRSRARWYDGEISEVAEAFKAGRSISQIAHAHSRSVYAIEHQLDRRGYLSTAAIHRPDRETPAPVADPSRTRVPEADYQGAPRQTDCDLQ